MEWDVYQADGEVLYQAIVQNSEGRVSEGRVEKINLH